MATAFKKKFLQVSGFIIAGLSGFGIFRLKNSAEGAACFSGGYCAEYDFVLSILLTLVFIGVLLFFIGTILKDEKEKF